MADARALDWPHCGHGADSKTDPVGCRGIRVSDYSACLAHLTDDERATYLDSLAPGANIDHRGTPFTDTLLNALLKVLQDPDTERPLIGRARFAEATFTGKANFDGTTFTGEASFDRATFLDDAEFFGASFHDVDFHGATIYGDLSFRKAKFAVLSWLGPLVCGNAVVLSAALFKAPVTTEIAAVQVHCVRTQFESAATLYLRYATLTLSDAVLSAPVAVIAEPKEFPTARLFELEEEPLTVAGRKAKVWVDSVRGVDAAHLVLTKTDLSYCEFGGAFHLDQLRLDGSTFAFTPTGLHLRWPFWWTRRRALAEEHYWRSLKAPLRRPPRGWFVGEETDPMLTAGPGEVAAIYRQLRKSLEDAKNEPDAADFYYGEMEMRRKDDTRPRWERALLTAYWMVSGYGLRALRAFGSLLFAMGLTMVLLMWVGLPADPPAPRTRGTVTAGQKIDVTTKPPGPGGAAPRPMSERFTRERVEKAGRTAVNSVVFRSAGQGLTVAGTYIEMTSRLVEPVLLALALLAVRGRVKR